MELDAWGNRCSRYDCDRFLFSSYLEGMLTTGNLVSLFDGFLFIAMRRTLKRKQLRIPFALTILFQCLLMYAFKVCFPLSNSLVTILFVVPGAAVLAFVYALFARILDPHGPRPT
jgi:hypothetical protein